MQRSDRHVQLITAAQQRLFAYIYSLVGDPEAANDVLQETNLVLWHKADQFEEGTDFVAWAYRVAHLQVMAYRKRVSRDRLVFDDAVLEALSRDAAARLERFDARQVALQQCLSKLTERQRQMVNERYMSGEPVRAIAGRLGMNANAVGQALHRARMALLQCVRRELASGAEEGGEP